jgi:hypothetical protein
VDSHENPGNWRFIAILAAFGVALLGLVVYAIVQNPGCGIACGPPIDVPVVLGASVEQYTAARAPADCGLVTHGYPQAVVCLVEPFPGSSGTIVLVMTSLNGNSQVAFGLYSSNPYVQFNSTYSCLYSSSHPDYNTPHCPVYGSDSVYRFDYKASRNISSQVEVVLTIIVTKTCCLP